MAGFTGDLDEFTIVKTARSAGFIKLTAVSQGQDQSKLMRVQRVDKETASWLCGYFGILIQVGHFRRLALIIGILIVMALASWVVMVDAQLSEASAEGQRRFRADLPPAAG